LSNQTLHNVHSKQTHDSAGVAFGIYRHQAKYDDGQLDGKIQMLLGEAKNFQAIARAGNN
jgi:hypothetical protein